MGKKNLEQLFRETFTDFERMPDEGVWKSIEQSLDKKKQKRRVLPIWLPLGGIAAALAILFIFMNPFEGDTLEDQINSDTETTPVSESVNFPADSNMQPGNSTANGLDGLTEINGQIEGSRKDETIKAGNSNKSADLEMVTNGSDKEGVAFKSKKTENAESRVNRDAVALNSSTSNGNGDQNNAFPVANHITNDGIAKNEGSHSAINKEASFDVTENKAQDAMTVNEEKPTDLLGKKSIYDAIREQQEQEEAIAAHKAGKWSVGPSVAPVYFNGSGNGSPIHTEFASNPKSGNLNLSYGLTVAYEVGKKLKVRSGIHKVNYGYDTNDVVFSSSLNSSSSDMYANIDYSKSSENIVVMSKKTALRNNSKDISMEISANSTPSLDGKMVQQMGYIEVPVELNYAVLDKKFGVDIIGGVSSLFLVDNRVMLESRDLVTEMGEANNVNNLNFSANVGMGLNYNFTPKFQFNIEPMFKYQLNTFSKTAGDFRPYSIGVYSGVRFKF